MHVVYSHVVCMHVYLYVLESTRDFVANSLGPILTADHPSVKILGFDHNKVCNRVVYRCVGDLSITHTIVSYPTNISMTVRT